MTIERDSSLVKLDRRHIVELADGSGATLTCVAGALWITQHARSEDLVLTPGRSLVLDGCGTAVIQAISAAAFRLERCPAPGFVGRVQAWLAHRPMPRAGLAFR